MSFMCAMKILNLKLRRLILLRLFCFGLQDERTTYAEEAK